MHASLYRNLMTQNNGTFLSCIASSVRTQNSSCHFPLPNKENNKQVQNEKASHWVRQHTVSLVPIISNSLSSTWPEVCIVKPLRFSCLSCRVFWVPKSSDYDTLARKWRKMNMEQTGKERKGNNVKGKGNGKQRAREGGRLEVYWDAWKRSQTSSFHVWIHEMSPLNNNFCRGSSTHVN